MSTDDLSSKLSGLMNDPEGMEKIKSIASMFLNQQGGEKEEKTDYSDPDERGPAREESAGMPFDPADLNMMLKLKSAMGMMNSAEDDGKYDLLYALKPHLKPLRRDKVDEAAKLLRLFKLAPLFKESGLF